VELRYGQAERIDELVLRIDPGLIADLFRVEIVGQTEHPVLSSIKRETGLE
jgi:hypothetical protein